MPRTLATLLTLATLSAIAPLLSGQAAYSAGPGNAPPSYLDSNTAGASFAGPVDTQPPAPIERSSDGAPIGAQPPANYNPPQANYNQQRPMNRTSEPSQGIWLVTAPDAVVETVAATADHTELRVEHGRANVDVHHPSDRSEILVDLPGGQVSLLKDGLYTFNADTNTVRVLHGEAEIAAANAKPLKVKEDHQFTFAAGANQAHAQEADPNQLRADLLQRNYADGREGDRHGDGYGYPGPYGNGFAYGGYPYYVYGYGYPYYAFGGPFGYGYPFGYGIGFGYYGGFRGGFGGYGGFRR